MSFLARLVSGNSRNLEKFELGALSSSATPKEIVYFLPAIKIILQFWSINILLIHVAVNKICMFLEQ